MSWTEHLHLTRRLGSGGQGVVYLSERRGTDNFTLPVALKIFSPARYDDARSYDEAMAPDRRRSPPASPRFSRTTCSTCTTSSTATASASWRWSGSTATT